MIWRRRVTNHFAIRILMLAAVAWLSLLANVGCRNRTTASPESAASIAPRSNAGAPPAYSNPGAIRNDQPSAEEQAAQSYLDRLRTVQSHFTTVCATMRQRSVELIAQGRRRMEAIRAGNPDNGDTKDWDNFLWDTGRNMKTIISEAGSLSPPNSAVALNDSYKRYLQATFDALGRIWSGLKLADSDPKAGSEYLQQQKQDTSVTIAEQTAKKEFSAFVAKWHLHPSWQL